MILSACNAQSSAAKVANGRSLPKGWVAVRDPKSNKTYYYNTVTRKSTLVLNREARQHLSLSLSLCVCVCMCVCYTPRTHTHITSLDSYDTHTNNQVRGRNRNQTSLNYQDVTYLLRMRKDEPTTRNVRRVRLFGNFHLMMR